MRSEHLITDEHIAHRTLQDMQDEQGIHIRGRGSLDRCSWRAGRGVCEYTGVDPNDIDILMGTFTKVGVSYSMQLSSSLSEHT